MDAHSDIAIVGMGIRLSGGVTTPNEFWSLLVEGRNGLCEVPSTRYRIDSFHTSGKQQGVKPREGYFLKDDPDLFDAEFFGINPKEVERMDPQQRHLLEVTAECLEDAGEIALRGTNVGCFVGVFGEDWLGLTSQDPQTVDRYYVSSNGHFALSNRISYQFDWHGPSLTIQTACSSSMVSLHEACQALLRNDCNAAVVGGVSLILNPTMTMAMSDSKVLAADGVCKTFDAAADGYGRGEGVTVILIKRLEDAIRNNDNIRAVIRATSTNFDGKTPSISAPDVDRQESLIRQTYQRAGLSNIGETAFFECHGTGTQIGDIVEVTAITRALQGANLDPRDPTWIGSVKPNVGHTEGASGLTSVIKATLCLEHDTIPPNIFFSVPNPSIPFEAANLSVPLEPKPFPVARKKRVSVNSFGVGGSNGHAILDSASSFLGRSDGLLLNTTQADSSNNRYLLVLSAKQPDVLEKRIASIVEYKNKNEHGSLEDLSYTLCCRREHFGHRAFAIASSQRPLSRADFRASQLHSGSRAVMVWLFTGQGAQWIGMAQQLLIKSAEFRNDMEHLDVALRALPEAPEWNIREELAKSALEGSRVNETQISQPLSTAIAIGLVNQLRRWGIMPNAVIGHSSGEIAAAYAAGAITAASAISMAYYRGLVSKLREGEGSMASIGLGWIEVQPYLRETTDVVIACCNSRRNTVLSGSLLGLDQIINLVKQDHPEVFCRKLRVTVPYHSPQMRDASALYEQSIAAVIQHTGSMVPMYSTVSLKKITDPRKLDASYWGRGLVSPVQFNQAIEDACSESRDSQMIFLEIGAHSTFFPFIKQITEGSDTGNGRIPIYIPTLTRNDPDASTQLLSAVGCLYSSGIAPSMPSVTGVKNVLCNLPLYPWTHRQYRRESRLARDWRLRAAPHHELLGCRVTATSDLEPAWRNLIQVGDVLWISDHVLDGKVIFPVAGYIAMAGAASMQLRNHSDSYSVRNLVLHSFLTLLPIQQLEILTSLRKTRYNDLMESEWYSFSISSYDGTGWTNHCDGQVRAEYGDCATQKRGYGASPPPYSRRVNATQWYKATRNCGYEYGQSFQGLENITADPVQIAAIGTINKKRDSKEDSVYVSHPTVIDRCLQLMGVAQGHGLPRRLPTMEVPKSIEFVFVGKNGPKTTASVRGTNDGNQTLLWNAAAWSEGREVLSIRNMRCVAVNKRLKKATPIPPLTSLRWSPLLDLVPLSDPHLLTKRSGSTGKLHYPWSKFLKLLGHSRPRLRILELGVAAPGLTDVNLKQMRTSEGTRLFSSYTLTSPSTAALDPPKLEFDGHPGVNFKVFNAQGNPNSQGLEAHSFDLVLTSDSTSLLSQTALTSIRQLLAPSGWLLVQHVAYEEVIQENIQTDEATISETTRLRNEMLKTAELQFLEELIDKDGESGTMKLTLLAKATSRAPLPSKDMTLLSGDTRSALADTIASELVSQGYNVTWSNLGVLPAPRQCVISFLDFDGPALATLSEEKFQQLKDYLLSSQSTHILWLTKPTQEQCKDPRYGIVHGLLRSLRQECGLDLYVLQLDEEDTSTSKLVIALNSWIGTASKQEGMRQDSEFAIIDGKIHVGRYHWVSALPRPENRLLPIEPPLKLQLDPDVSSDRKCSWVANIDAELQEEYIQVDMRYVGLNFRDILVATGRIGYKGELGFEASGIVSRVGSKVHEFEVGDRVGILGSGLCQTRINTPAASCWKLPPHLSLESAASSLIPFLTALYSLVHVGGLRKGQSVLVHSACGGVGLASIQVCQLLGAEIYATVGNNDKVEYLETKFSLPRNRIFSSRDDSFLADLMTETGGRGVDLVLNSLAGKLLQASWECVASFGKMLELGKIDISTHGNLSMGPFAKNRAFIGVDILQLGSERPNTLVRLMGEVCGYFATGQLSALPVQSEYEASAAPHALRQMQAGQHIGRFVLSIPTDRSGLLISTDLPDVYFRSDASYLLVGGTGGLGRAISNWMIERGAKELVYLSRTAQQAAEDDEFVQELGIQGCNAVFVEGSVVDLKDVQRAIAACREPLGGVIQLSAVLRDRTFGNMTYKEWTECLDPKVTGTWHLHDALQHQPNVDFFVVFGSLAGVYGNGGQANYAAANTYLESFVHYRRQLGLPCSLLNLGPVEDAGMLSKDYDLLQAMRTTSVHFLSLADVCKGLSIAICNSPIAEPDESSHTKQEVIPSPAVVNLGMSASMDLSELSSRAIWINDARFSMYANLEANWNSKPNIVDDRFRMFMAKVEDNPTILDQPETEIVICREIARLMTGYLGFGEEIGDDDIGNIAIDSLMAIEIKDWVRGNMNLDVSMDQTSRARTSVLAGIQASAERIIHYHRSDEEQAILDWLMLCNYGLEQSNHFKKRQPGTGQWLLDSDEFLEWVGTEGRTLYCPGISEEETKALLPIVQIYAFFV